MTSRKQGSLLTQTEMHIKDLYSKVKIYQMERVFTAIRMETNTKECSKMDGLMGMGP